ncbi:MAG: YkvA family protein [Eubacteriaceae bacterium]|nr:YkvA family protein [Eubacteriaceae bacterium]
MQQISMSVILKRIRAIASLLADKTVPFRKKALVVFGLVYLFLPVDLIPPILFPFGFIDDLILWIYILWTLKDELDVYWMGEKPEDLSKKYSRKNIVEGVQYEVKNDAEEAEETSENVETAEEEKE